MTSDESPVLLFDGVCDLCSRAVRFVLRHDRTGRVRFASLQSDAGKQLLQEVGLPAEHMESLVFVENGQAYTRSEAVLRLAAHLNAPWRYGRWFLILPRAIRDLFYDLIAANRYRWFGKNQTCWVPSSEWKHRFLEQ